MPQNNPLDVLKKFRAKVEKPKKGKAKHVDPGATPEQDLALPSKTIKSLAKADPDYLDVWEYFQQSYYMETYIADIDTLDTRVRHGDLPDQTKNKATIRKMKRRMEDYKPGPVKIYTKAEIAEYERERAHGTEV